MKLGKVGEVGWCSAMEACGIITEGRWCFATVGVRHNYQRVERRVGFGVWVRFELGVGGGWGGVVVLFGRIWG